MDTLTTSQEILKRLSGATTLLFREAMSARIASLLEAFQEDSGGVAVSVNSLQSLLAFLEAHPTLKYPAITLTPSGDFYASWKENRTQVFSVQFLDNGQVRFVVLRNGPTAQLSGLTTPATLMNLVAPLHVLEWAGQ